MTIMIPILMFVAVAFGCFLIGAKLRILDRMPRGVALCCAVTLIIFLLVVNVNRWKADAALEQAIEDNKRFGRELKAQLERDNAPTIRQSPANRRYFMQDYQRLHAGMDYLDAIIAIGSGEEMSRAAIAGFESKTYIWQNHDGSNIVAVFSNSKLVSKAQIGLTYR